MGTGRAYSELTEATPRLRAGEWNRMALGYGMFATSRDYRALTQQRPITVTRGESIGRGRLCTVSPGSEGIAARLRGNLSTPNDRSANIYWLRPLTRRTIQAIYATYE